MKDRIKFKAIKQKPELVGVHDCRGCMFNNESDNHTMCRDCKSGYIYIESPEAKTQEAKEVNNE